MSETILCPRCEMPILPSFDNDGKMSALCMNCGLQYENDDVISSYGMAVVSYKDGKYEYEILRSPLDHDKIEAFKMKINQAGEAIDRQHCYLTCLNTNTFGINDYFKP